MCARSASYPLDGEQKAMHRRYIALACAVRDLNGGRKHGRLVFPGEGTWPADVAGPWTDGASQRTNPSPDVVRGIQKVRISMAVSSLDKDVATRLYAMLAVSELDAAAVKADHASYAKLQLLTAQAKLLQRQAVQVVNKSVSEALDTGAAPELPLSEPRNTALTTEFNEGTCRMLRSFSVNDQTVATIKRDRAACAKLSLLADQVQLLQEQAKQVVDEADLNRHLTEISARTACRLVPGTIYYHYTQNGKDAISRIAETEWASYEAYHGKYLYDFDFAFRRLDDDDHHKDEEEVHCALLPSTLATPATQPSRPPEATTASSGALRAPVLCSVLSRW